MRKNKKLLLASVAALGALAIGVGATSTFAWYQATTKPRVTSSVYNSSQIATTTTSISLGDVVITFSIESISGVQLTNLVEVESTPTLHKGMVSGGTVTPATGAVVGGQVTTTPLTNEDTIGNFVKAYSVTAVYTTASAQQKAALAGSTVTATLTAAGQAKLRADQALTGADDDSHSLTVTFGQTEASVEDVDSIKVTGEKYVRIQAYRTGADYVDIDSQHTNDKLSIAALNEEL